MMGGTATIRAQIMRLIAFVVVAVVIGVTVIFVALDRSNRYGERLRSEALHQQELIKRLNDAYGLTMAQIGRAHV
jgi:predicted DNA repair protein MutK